VAGGPQISMASVSVNVENRLLTDTQRGHKTYVRLNSLRADHFWAEKG
jgi:hypothetical protein